MMPIDALVHFWLTENNHSQPSVISVGLLVLLIYVAVIVVLSLVPHSSRTDRTEK